MTDPLDLLICSTCGTQYSTSSSLTACKICDDPRQYVPPTGQTWTTLRNLRTSKSYTNIFTPDPTHPTSLISIHTSPQQAIGQRAYLCRLPTGRNILWDCIAYIDDDTIARIRDLGGIAAIVISHPHYYTTNLVWAEAFDCPVFLAAEDKEWVMRVDPRRQVFWEGTIGLGMAGVGNSGSDKDTSDMYRGTSAVPELGFGLGLESGVGVTAVEADEKDLVVIKTGGHFPGSLVLYWRSLKMLLIADTIAVVPSGKYWVDRMEGTASFTFMWSYPNMIPLPAEDVYNIWKAIKDLDFVATRGAFIGMDTYVDSKKRMLDSAKIFIKAMGYLDHAIHEVEC